MFKLLFMLYAIFSICRANSCSFSKNDKNIIDCCKTIFVQEADDKEFNEGAAICTANGANVELCSLIKCILKYQGVLKGDKINVNQTVSYALRGKDEAVWINVITDVVKSCSGKMSGKDCPELYFLECMDVSSFVNCPKSEWQESATCTQIRTSYSSCV